MMKSIRVQGLRVFAGGLLALAAVGCSGEAASEGAVDSESVGAHQDPLWLALEDYAWANRSAGSFNAPSDYSHGEWNEPIKVTWLAVGQARVDFPYGLTGGNVQVTAYGSGNARCKVESWVRTGTTDDDHSMAVYVRCHTPAGVAVSAPFVVLYGIDHYANYVWADRETASSYTPSEQYSDGVPKTITRRAKGSYTVTMSNDPIENIVGGNVQVTAYGPNENYCKVESWFTSGGQTSVHVACFDASGARADSRFSMRYSDTGRDYGPAKAAFTWANDATSASYTPSPTYQEPTECHQPNGNGPLTCTHGTDNRAGRLEKGSYWVMYPNVGLNPSAAFVTAYGSGAEYCKISGWNTDGTANIKVFVNCFDSDGKPADTQFSQLFLSGPK